MGIILAILFWAFIGLAVMGGIITFVRIIKNWWKGNSFDGGLPGPLR